MNSNTRTNVLAGFIFALLLGAVYLGIHTGAAFSHAAHVYSWNPLRLLIDMALEGAPWPKAATVFTIVFLVVAVVLFTALLSWQARRAANTRGRVPMQHLASRREVAPFMAKARRMETKRLHPAHPGMSCGLPVGTFNDTRQWVFQGWEDTGVYVIGTRQGKTSAIVTRHIEAAPGACVFTSTKQDGVREAIALRSGEGSTVYLFDPDGIYRIDETTPDFVFNPLSMVTSYKEAQDLAGIFEASTTDADDRGGDAQFTGSGRNLLACFLLAAAAEEKPLSLVWQWLSKYKGDEVVALLENHGHEGPAAVVSGILGTAERTRTSTYFTAQRMAGGLAYDDLVRWTDTEGVRLFDPVAFATSTDTLGLLAEEGGGSSGAILTALVRAVCESAKKVANRNGGRLPVPMVMELDECATIVRWPELPAQYSTYGSRGIVLSAYFQARSQAYKAFGKDGWDTMWSTARIAVLGPGVKDDDFLRSLSALAGEHEETTYGSSTSRTGEYSTSTNTRRQATLSVDQLGSLPKWRMVMFPANGAAAYLKMKPWFEDRDLSVRINGAKAAR
jgi:type IV secretory pathway TraG/TraD family ATPase VirD4